LLDLDRRRLLLLHLPPAAPIAAAFEALRLLGLHALDPLGLLHLLDLLPLDTLRLLRLVMLLPRLVALLDALRTIFAIMAVASPAIVLGRERGRRRCRHQNSDQCLTHHMLLCAGAAWTRHRYDGLCRSADEPFLNLHVSFQKGIGNLVEEAARGR
jgi:hypothetical protein